MAAAWAADGGPPWTFGDPALDGLLPGRALDAAALHEVRPAAYGDWPTALLMALRLAVRRSASAAHAPRKPHILWCHTIARARDLGRLHAPGLAALGLDPGALIEVEAGRAKDVLWAMEEGLASGGLALVVGSVDGVELTPSRRLGLAAAAGGTPCLLLTAPRGDGAPTAATRWRAARAPSAAHPFDPDAPGAPRLVLRLERCRGTPLLEGRTLIVEWCHETHRFRLAAGLADRAPAAGRARGGAA